jgi:hypothetical protein
MLLSEICTQSETDRRFNRDGGNHEQGAEYAPQVAKVDSAFSIPTFRL